MISKADCVAALDKKDTDDFKSFCDIIDERLKKYNRSEITVGIPTDMSEKVLYRIVKEYSHVNSGWKVEKGYDQKEGSWLSFS